MLNPPTPFPYQGSYALTIDTDLPEAEQRAELVRILYRREGAVVAAFPLRTGASGNKTIPADSLIDFTPLDAAERKEMAELASHLADRARLTPKMKAQKARHDQLRQRAIWEAHGRPLLARARALELQRKAA